MLGQCSDCIHQDQELVSDVIERSFVDHCLSRVKVGEILPNVNTPKIHSMYGKARESEGRFKEACAAYIKAGEWENAIR